MALSLLRRTTQTDHDRQVERDQETVIEFSQVSKRFILRHDRPRSFQELAINLLRRNGQREEFWALRDISFALTRGQSLGIIGQNGAGKSTLLRLIARILEPTTGHVTARGRISALLELGAGFHPDLTGRENIYLNGSLLGLSRREMARKYESIVRFAELERFIDIPLKHYSSGMFMRLGFAVAVHVDPEILLIDEVLAVGDRSFQAKCLERIHQFRQQGKTIVFVSHDLNAVVALCDRVLWLENGRVMGDGVAREIVSRYMAWVRQKEAAELAAQSVPVPEQPAPQYSPDGADHDHAVGHGGKSRWGARDIEITSVRLLDGHDQESYLLESGAPLTIEIAYRVHRPVADPVFGIGIYRDDGVWCYGTNTDVEQIALSDLGRSGLVQVVFDHLELLEGTYTLDVAIHSPAGEPYDYHRPYCTFKVWSSVKDYGVSRLPHRWYVHVQVEAPALAAHAG